MALSRSRLDMSTQLAEDGELSFLGIIGLGLRENHHVGGGTKHAKDGPTLPSLWSFFRTK